MVFTDINGEPKIFHHFCDSSRKGQKMTRQERHEIGIELLVNLYREEGFTIRNINPSINRDYPNFVMKSKIGREYHVAVNTAPYPVEPDMFNANEYSEIKQLAEKSGATSVYAGLAFTNVTSPNSSNIIAGGRFYVLFTGLVSL
jgi:hypothetical protein